MRALTQQLDYSTLACRVARLLGCGNMSKEVSPRASLGGYGLSLIFHSLLPFPGCHEVRSFALPCISIYHVLPLYKPEETGESGL